MNWLEKHRGLVLLAVVGILAAAWRWTDLGDWLSLDRLSAWGQTLDDYRLTGLLVIGAYVLASVVMIPINLLVLATSLTFEPLRASLYAFAGSVAAATVTFWIGRVMGKKALRRLSSSLVENLNEKLDEHGVLAIAVVRLLPIAPFGVVNMAAGTTGMRARDFVLGSAIGMTPGIIAIVLLEDRLQEVLRRPSAANLALFAALSVGVFAALFIVRRRLRSDPSTSA